MYTFQVSAVLDIVRLGISSALAVAGESAWVVPLAFPLRPWAVDIGLLPLTLVEVRSITVDRDAGPASLLLSCAATVHHVRRRQPDMGAESVCLARLGAIAAAVENDPRLLGVGGDSVPVHEAMAMSILVGTQSRLQQELTAAGQEGSLAAASLDLIVRWYEKAG